jgi:pimeloyl-ACP methyl ester carboxylesterase
VNCGPTRQRSLRKRPRASLSALYALVADVTAASSSRPLWPFSPEVVDHLRRNPRRPITMAAMQARRSAAWRTIPTTVLLGRTDQLVTDEERRWATDHLNDVRFLETDHFVAFRQPEAISDAVIEALETDAMPSDV